MEAVVSCESQMMRSLSKLSLVKMTIWKKNGSCCFRDDKNTMSQQVTCDVFLTMRCLTSFCLFIVAFYWVIDPFLCF